MNTTQADRLYFLQRDLSDQDLIDQARVMDASIAARPKAEDNAPYRTVRGWLIAELERRHDVEDEINAHFSDENAPQISYVELLAQVIEDVK